MCMVVVHCFLGFDDWCCYLRFIVDCDCDVSYFMTLLSFYAEPEGNAKHSVVNLSRFLCWFMEANGC